MSFLRVSGWPVSARPGATERSTSWGELGETYVGSPTRAYRGRPRSWDVEAVVYDQSDADTFAFLLDGRGHHFPFDLDATSDAGLEPDTVASGNWGVQARVVGPLGLGGGVFGVGYLLVLTSVTWDVGCPDTAWTVMYWRKVGSFATREHVVVRSDGARFLNGVRADATSTTELTVSGGGVALSVGSYDDLVVLPHVASDGFVTSFYRWTTGCGLTFWLPFDNVSARDVIGDLVPSSLTATLPRFGGQVNGGLLVNGGGQDVVYAAAPAINLLGKTELTVEFGLNPIPGAVNLKSIVAKNTFFVGYQITGTEVTPVLDRLALSFRVFGASGICSVASLGNVASTLKKGEWHHLIFTWAAGDGVARMYVDGTEVPRALTTVTVVPGAATDDSAIAMTIGGGGFVPMQSSMDEFRIYSTRLTAAEIRERAHAFLIERQPGPVATSFSPLPNLETWGEANGCRSIVACAQPAEESYVQHGQRSPSSTSAWTNNARNVKGTLDQIIAPELALTSQPLWSYVVDELYLSGTALRPRHGRLSNATVVGAVPITRGPYGYARSGTFSGAGGNRVELNGEVAAGLFFQRQITLLAWVQRAALGAIHTVFQCSYSVGVVKVMLRVTAANMLEAQVRAASAEAVQTLTSTVTLADAGWHLVGLRCDVGNRVLDALKDDAGVDVAANFQTSTPAFTATEFGPGANATNYVGSDAASNNWSGGIAVVSLFPRVLSQNEIRTIWRAGSNGVFR